MSRTPGLGELLREVIRTAALDLRVALPCRVEAYDLQAQTVDVLPGYKSAHRREDGSEVVSEPPVIPNVPVSWPRGGGGVLTFPLKVGDTGMIVICDRALDAWRDGDGSPRDPRDHRAHQLTDAVFMPGLHTDGDPVANADGENIVLGFEDGASRIELRPNGDLLIDAERIGLGDGADSRLLRATEVRQWLGDARVPSPFGPLGPLTPELPENADTFRIGVFD